MGAVARFFGAEPATKSNILGMSGNMSMPKDMRMERDREVARRVARGQVIEAEVRVIGYVAQQAQRTAAAIQRSGDAVATASISNPAAVTAVYSITDAAVLLVVDSMGKLADA